jgi:hypothetical protein
VNKKVLLAVYGVTITNDTKDTQMPSQFGGNTDLLQVFHDFAMSVYTLAAEMPRPGNESIALAGPENPFPLPKLVEEDRELYGYFDTGRNGESLTVRQLASKGKKGKGEDTTVASITRDMHVTREVFFYLKVPKGGKKAFLVLQRAQGLGVKGLVEYTFQRYLNANKVQRHGFTLNNLLDRRVFSRMLQSGQFKELTIIKEGIPDNIDDLNNRSKVAPPAKGTQRISYLAVDLPDSWQKWAVDLMSTKGRSNLTMTEGEVGVDISIGGEEQFVSEVTFRLELNKKQKTFHIVHADRDQPDVDVTDEVHRDDETGMLDLKDLVEQARSLVDDVNFTSGNSVDPDTGEVLV